MEWAGKEFNENEHLGANHIIKLNNRHPFFTKIYSPVLKAAGVVTKGQPTDGAQVEKLSEEELQKVARIVQVGLDLRIVAYAKAERLATEHDASHGNLRTKGGM